MKRIGWMALYLKSNNWCARQSCAPPQQEVSKMKNTLVSTALAPAIIGAPAIISGAYASDNDLTGLIPDLYDGLEVVSQELVGFIPSVFRNASAERAAVGENVTYPIAPPATTQDITPSMTPPTPADQDIGNGNIAITKAKKADFAWTGEEQRGLNNGPGFLSVQAQQFAQALRVLTNEVENDIAREAELGASRMYGTPTTTPFASDVGAAAQLKKILDDNGAPMSERSLVIDTTAGAALRTLKNLTAVNEAGTSMTLRDGELLNLSNFSIKESAAVSDRAIGTAAATADTTAAGFAVGATLIGTAAAGSGTILAGDVVTFAGDTNQYVVAVGNDDVSGAGSITLNAPGLRVAIPASTTEITVVARGTRNIGFTRNAIHLVARAPALLDGKDMAVERMMLTDPRSGLTFEVSIYAGYRMMSFEVALAWGTKVIKKEHVAGIFG